MNIKHIPSNLIADVRGGVCNCIGYSWCVNSVGVHGASYNSGGYFCAGQTNHANVCRNLIGNLTAQPISCNQGGGVRFIGCYPQDEIGMNKFLG